MDFYIVNESKDPRCDPASVEAWANAVDLQILDDFGPAWNLYANVFFVENEGKVPEDGCVIRLIDEDVPGEMGDHDEEYDKVEARIIIPEIPDDLIPSVISHEILEALGNPYANLWAQFDWAGPGKMTAREMCDGVQDGIYEKHLESVGKDVKVSNFVLPRYFDAEATSGTFDFLGVLTAPFSKSEGGYMILMSGGEVSYDAGASIAPWRNRRTKTRFLRMKLRTLEAHPIPETKR